MTALFFIATIVFFLGIDWVVQRMKRGSAAEEATAPQPAAHPDALRIPEGIFFAKSHTWINLFPSGKVRLGVDDFVGNLMENPRISFTLNPGDVVEKGDPLLVVEDGDRRVTIRSPLAGEVLAVNLDLEKSPQLMRESLFSEGWAYSIRPRRIEELRSMLIGEESRSWMSNELGRLRDLLAGAASLQTAPVSLQDGGPPATGLLRRLDRNKVAEFEEQFLQVRQ
jgi:glycine cleavage system H protein